ncbi:hypothetical protein NCS52_00881200 [Fusarium sp. LHS14.1]|nr:hypothetical protein NCS52_00881200 [Fusarium sp. LHS14.1]
MAEVLGIVAGAAQLLDLSTRVLVASSSLYGKLKNIPDEIETLKKNTELFIDLLWMISSDFDGPINSQVHSLHVTHRITSILHDARKESEGLALLLEGLSSNSSSAVRRKWSAVVGATKEKDIAERCRRIESLKSTLQLWYQHQGNAGLRGVQHQLSQITISQNAVQTSIGLLAQQSSTMIDSNQAIVKRLDSHEDSASSLNGPLGHRRRRFRRNGAFCTCRPSSSSTYLRIYGLQLFCSRETAHTPNCPQRDGSTSWSCGVRALSPRIQMMVGIQLGGWTLSMVGRLSPHNIVDPKNSPAFIAIYEAASAARAIKSRAQGQRDCRGQGHSMDTMRPPHIGPGSTGLTVQEDAESLFRTLFQKLRESFESGTASPNDHTLGGTTLLHRFALVAMQFVEFHELLFHVLDDIVKLLVAGNADPNASADFPFETPIFYVLIHIWTTLRLQQNHLDRILINHGCNASQILQNESREEPNITAFLKKNPRLLEDHDQYPAHVATIQKSEARLSFLLMQNKIDLKTKTPCILSLAVGWTAGLQVLLDAGANPDDAISAAIWEHHLPSIELLIDHGCSLFSNGRYFPGNDIFSEAHSSAATPEVICLLVQKLVERRLELQQLASKELSETCLERLGLHKHHHSLSSPDYKALEVFRQLEAHKVQVPNSLWPGSWTTLYHHDYATDTLAKALYNAGFLSIDELDEHGHSPLMKTMLHWNFRARISLVQWYLSKGSRLPRSLVYVEFLARAIDFAEMVSESVWITKDLRLFGPLKIFQELHPEGVEQRDSCRCWCSTTGCSPIGIILRRAYFWFRFTFTRRQRWLFNLARYSSLGLSLGKDTFAEICRLEIFDRLGMAHTCSHGQRKTYHSDDNYYSGNDCGDKGSSERVEIQEEDRHLKQALDSYLELYLCLLHTHADRFDFFWMAWWIAIEYFLPFEKNSVYYCRRRVKLDNVCDPQSYDEAQSHDSYEPNVEAITAFLADCVPQLASEASPRFWDQLKLKGDDSTYYGPLIDYDSDIDGDWDDGD